ncbi:MAG: glycosyltransferase [Acidobacteria bacterium]|nr:glycosyltransferase [Acidobacteriota bacterium]MCA1640402.1 glycosyltransferase [Acidobacteriota bacterium]
MTIGSVPLVDIVMPTYNHQKFIAQAIESVLAQETDFAYRLLIGDDCSTDGAREIISSYAERYPDRIEAFLFSPRVGAFDRDRVGVRLLRQSEAKYIALLEGDDYWTDPRKLQKQVDYLESHPACSLCFHDATMFYEDGSEPPRRLCAPDQKAISTLEDIAAGNFLIPCTILFRNHLLGELPDCYYTVRSADWIMFMLLAQHGSLDYINEVMAAYRVHGAGIWSRLNYLQRLREHVRTYEAIDAHLGYSYHAVISEQISRVRENISEQRTQHANSCLDTYHSLATGGRFREALPLLAQAARSRPSAVLRPRRLAAVIKNGLLGAAFGHRLRARRGAERK